MRLTFRLYRLRLDPNRKESVATSMSDAIQLLYQDFETTALEMISCFRWRTLQAVVRVPKLLFGQKTTGPPSASFAHPFYAAASVHCLKKRDQQSIVLMAYIKLYHSNSDTRVKKRRKGEGKEETEEKKESKKKADLPVYVFNLDRVKKGPDKFANKTVPGRVPCDLSQPDSVRRSLMIAGKSGATTTVNASLSNTRNARKHKSSISLEASKANSMTSKRSRSGGKRKRSTATPKEAPTPGKRTTRNSRKSEASIRLERSKNASPRSPNKQNSCGPRRSKGFLISRHP